MFNNFKTAGREKPADNKEFITATNAWKLLTKLLDEQQGAFLPRWTNEPGTMVVTYAQRTSTDDDTSNKNPPVISTEEAKKLVELLSANGVWCQTDQTCTNVSPGNYQVFTSSIRFMGVVNKDAVIDKLEDVISKLEAIEEQSKAKPSSK